MFNCASRKVKLSSDAVQNNAHGYPQNAAIACPFISPSSQHASGVVFDATPRASSIQQKSGFNAARAFRGVGVGVVCAHTTPHTNVLHTFNIIMCPFSSERRRRRRRLNVKSVVFDDGLCGGVPGKKTSRAFALPDMWCIFVLRLVRCNLLRVGKSIYLLNGYKQMCAY